MNNLDLIKQYVDTGLQIPEYQVNKLSPNLKKTYLRKRMITVNTKTDMLTDLEYNLIPDGPDKKEYDKFYEDVENTILKDTYNIEDAYCKFPDSLKALYIKTINKEGNKLEKNQYECTPDDLKYYYLHYHNLWGGVYGEEKKDWERLKSIFEK